MGYLRMNRRKTLVVRIVIATFILLLISTIASRSIYSMLLPTVTALNSSRGSLSYTSVIDATVIADTESETIAALDSWTIKDVLVSDGDDVKAGDALFQIDMSGYNIQITQLRTQIQQQKNSMNAVEWTGGDRLVKEGELKALELQLSQILNRIPRDGIVCAASAGSVKLLCETGPVASGSPLATISSTNGDISIHWKVSSADVPYYQNKELQFICEYSAINPGSGVYEVISSPIDLIALQLDDEQNMYIATGVPEDLGGLTLNTAVSIKSTRKSPQYDVLVPLSCIGKDSDGRDFILVLREKRTIWGIEKYVEKQIVSVAESNYQYAALKDFGTLTVPIAAYPSRQLNNGESVRVV